LDSKHIGIVGNNDDFLARTPSSRITNILIPAAEFSLLMSTQSFTIHGNLV